MAARSVPLFEADDDTATQSMSVRINPGERAIHDYCLPRNLSAGVFNEVYVCMLRNYRSYNISIHQRDAADALQDFTGP
jgi:hypothetical protein